MSAPPPTPPRVPVAALPVDVRAAFIARTYLHLFAGILGFTVIEVALFVSGLALPLARAFLNVDWLWVIGGFVLVSWLASRVAHKAASPVAQYAALCGFVAAEALIFVPMLFVAQYYAPGVIRSAALVTLIGFTALTVIAFTTRARFSFLRGVLAWSAVVAVMAVAAGAAFDFQLGAFFSVAMIGMAGGAILHDTSKVLHEYPEDRHVGAALELFASVALLSWYVLRLLVARRN